jgi:hypothetical protein
MNPLWFWALIALAAFLLLTAAALARGWLEPHSRARAPFAWVTLAGALLLAAYSLTAFLGLNADTTTGDELNRLRAQLVTTTSAGEQKQRRIDGFDAERAKLQAATVALNDQQSHHLVAVLQSIYGVQGASSRDSGEPAGTMPSAIATMSNTDKYALIERELATLRRLLELTAKNRKSTPDETAELLRLKDRLNTTVQTPNYDVSVYPDAELIKGRRGKYYVIDIKDAEQGARYFFQGGKYTISTRQEQFRSSLNTFVKDVLEKMQGRVEYQLMVRGSADSKPWRGQFEQGHEYRNLRYLKAIGGDKYVNEISDIQLGSPLNNGDLPNLRAAFLQKVVGAVYPVKEPVILQGVVSDKVSDGDRNAELILFVNW